MTSEYIENRFIELNEHITACVNDLDSFLSLTADMKGNYISFIHVKTSKGIVELPVYTGTATGTKDYSDRYIADRIKEHLVRWISDPEKFTGVPEELLKNGTASISFKVLKETDNFNQAKNIERLAILKYSTYLQMSPFRKFSASSYDDLDLCIEYKYRKPAFVYRLLQEGIILNNSGMLNMILFKLMDDDYNLKNEPGFDGVSFGEIINTRSQLNEMLPKGSDEYKLVKNLFDSHLVLNANSRGAYRNYIMDNLTKMVLNTERVV